MKLRIGIRREEGVHSLLGTVILVILSFLCNEVPRYFFCLQHLYLWPANLRSLQSFKHEFLNRSLHNSLIFLTMPSRSWHQTFYFLENRFSYQIKREIRATTLYSRFQLMDIRGCTFFIWSHPSFICLFFTTRRQFNAHDFSRGMTLKLSWRHHEKMATNRWMWRGEDTVFVVKRGFWVGEIERLPAEHGDQFVVD